MDTFFILTNCESGVAIHVRPSAISLVTESKTEGVATDVYVRGLSVQHVAETVDEVMQLIDAAEGLE